MDGRRLTETCAWLVALTIPFSLLAQEALRLTEIERYGGAASQNVDLGMVNSVAVHSSGDMYVSDQRTRQVVHIPASGEDIGELGRYGQGPGEFGRVGGVHVGAETIRVFDYDQQLIHHFDLDGNLIEAEQMPSVAGVNFSLGVNLRHGHWLGHVPPRIQPPQSGRDDEPARILFLSRDRIFIVQLGEYMHGGALWYDRDSRTSGPAGANFGDLGAWDVLGDSVIVVADGLTGIVRWMRVEMDSVVTTREVDSGLRPTPITEGDVQWAERMARDLFERPLPRNIGWKVPEMMSAITDVIVDEQGYVWLRKGMDRHSRTHPDWLVIGPDGGTSTSVSVPAHLAMKAIRDDRLYAVSTDDLDVPVIHVFRFDRRQLR